MSDWSLCAGTLVWTEPTFKCVSDLLLYAVVCFLPWMLFTAADYDPSIQPAQMLSFTSTLKTSASWWKPMP